MTTSAARMLRVAPHVAWLLATVLVTFFLVPAPPARGASGLRGCAHVSLIAHRGMADRHHTENTLRAFAHAYAKGVRSLETDLRLTADGQWILMHDITVDRTTNGAGVVSSLTLAQITPLRTNDGSVGGVPTLGQTLRLVERRPRMRMQIEIKTPGPDDSALDEVVAMTHAYGVQGRVSFTSYSPDVLQRLRAVDPRLRTGIVTIRQLSTEEIRRDGNQVLVERHVTSPAYVRTLHAAGVGVATWTINGKRALRQAANAGVDTIITNSPPRLRRYCRR